MNPRTAIAFFFVASALHTACGAAPAPVPPASDAPECAALAVALSAPVEVLAQGGLSADRVEAWMSVRRGPDGVEGTDDDATLGIADAREHLGEDGLRALGAGAPEEACSPVEVQLLAFNDFHGALEEPSGSSGAIRTEDGSIVPAGGLKWLVARIRALVATNPERTLIVGAGDMIGATPLISAAFHDEPAIEGLGLSGLALTSVGNHEFDEGTAELLRIQKGGCHPKDGCYRDTPWAGASFQYLAANAVWREGGAPILPATAMRRFGPARIGFIGMTLEGTANIVRPDGITDIRFLDEAETANRHAAELKARGAHVVVVLLHEGGFPKGSFRGCEAISGPVVSIAEAMSDDIDIIVSGHTHMPYICEIAGKLVTSAAANGRLVTDIDLAIDPFGRGLVKREATNVIVTRVGKAAADAEALVAFWAERVKGVAARVVGRIEGDLTRKQGEDGQSALGRLIADAHLFAEQDPSTGGAQIAFINSGGVRGDLVFGESQGGEAPGEVTFGEAFVVQPFQNELVTMTLTGTQLKRLLEAQFGLDGEERERPYLLQASSNLGYDWRESAAVGEKVVPASIRIGGEVVRPEGRYRVVMNAYLAGGGDRFPVLAEGTERRVGIVDVDALVWYLQKHQPLRLPPSAAIRRLP